jgi:hypothetical protein
VRAIDIFVGYRLKRDVDNKCVTWKKGIRGICKLSHFNAEEMHPIHLFKTRYEAQAWLHKPAHSVPMCKPRFLENCESQ